MSAESSEGSFQDPSRATGRAGSRSHPKSALRAPKPVDLSTAFESSKSESSSGAAASKIHPHGQLAYVRPDATMTLGEGLEEYYSKPSGVPST
jgi:hypothetical protein